MVKKLFFAFLSLLLLVSFTGMTHIVRTCKMGMTAAEMEQENCCADDAIAMDEECQDNILAVPSGQPGIVSQMDNCCQTLVAGVPLQYDSSAPVNVNTIDADFVLAVTVIPDAILESQIDCFQIVSSPSPPRDIPVLHSSLLI